MEITQIKTNLRDVEWTIGTTNTGVILSLRYESAPEVQAVDKRFQAKLLEEGKKGRRGDRAAILDWYRTERLVAHVANIQWTRGATYRGETPAFSDALIRELLDVSRFEAAHFLREFIDAEIGDATDFLASCEAS